jgi:flagellar biosynthesis regulator FlaF
MASILTHAIISSATEKVDTYVTSVNGIYDELNGIISTLTASNFNGDASDGYKVFYTQKVVPALTENLTAPQNSLMASLKDMLTGIEMQLLDTVDPQLGENNKNPGAES